MRKRWNGWPTLPADPRFQKKVRMVRIGLLHLANGLDESLHDVDGGDEMLDERIAALLDNVENVVYIANSVALDGR